MVKSVSKLSIQVNIETTDYQIREEKIRDQTYWVVPVVMMVEGVHHGSRGPLLYTQNELAATVHAWDGMPVTIGHPQDDKGKYISANSPSVLKGIVGRIYNAKMKGPKLTAEVWIEMNALTQVSTEAVEYIKEKKALDVSVGVFSEEVGEEGDFNGETYRAEATNIIPDHLALLPGQDGACNWEDGCGIRNNSKHGMKRKPKTEVPEWVDKAIHSQTFLLLNEGKELVENKASFNQIVSSVYDHLNSMDTDTKAFYLEEVYDSYVVYSEINKNTREKTMYKRSYKMTENEKIEFTGDATPVRKKVTFVDAGMKRTNFNSKSKITMNKKPCTCTVDSLIGNEATSFTEDDREWLSALSQEQLNKLAPKAAPAAPAPAPVANTAAPEKKEESLVAKNQDGSISINGKSIGEYIKEELSKETDAVKFIDNFMPDGLKNQMKSGLSMYQDRRATQIKEIVANSKFKAEQLQKWADEDLTALHESVVEKPVGNYAPLAGGFESEDGEDDHSNEISAMMSFAIEPAAEQPKK